MFDHGDGHTREYTYVRLRIVRVATASPRGNRSAMTVEYRGQHAILLMHRKHSDAAPLGVDPTRTRSPTMNHKLTVELLEDIHARGECERKNVQQDE